MASGERDRRTPVGVGEGEIVEEPIASGVRDRRGNGDPSTRFVRRRRTPKGEKGWEGVVPNSERRDREDGPSTVDSGGVMVVKSLESKLG
ncbi:hypothetical protein U1Q18_025455, partial [Sarracenia purpurea var. burkii]